MIVITNHAYSHWLGRCEKFAEGMSRAEQLEWIVATAEHGRLPTRTEYRALRWCWYKVAGGAARGRDSFIVNDEADVAFLLGFCESTARIISCILISAALADYESRPRRAGKTIREWRGLRGYKRAIARA